MVFMETRKFISLNKIEKGRRIKVKTERKANFDRKWKQKEGYERR